MSTFNRSKFIVVRQQYSMLVVPKTWFLYLFPITVSRILISILHNNKWFDDFCVYCAAFYCEFEVQIESINRNLNIGVVIGALRCITSPYNSKLIEIMFVPSHTTPPLQTILHP